MACLLSTAAQFGALTFMHLCIYAKQITKKKKKEKKMKQRFFFSFDSQRSWIRVKDKSSDGKTLESQIMLFKFAWQKERKKIVFFFLLALLLKTFFTAHSHEEVLI